MSSVFHRNKRKQRHARHTRKHHPLIVLVGQPNCGKSTLFNHVAGYRSISTNFPGTTVHFTESHIQLDGTTFDLVDLPGIYSLNSGDRATEETMKYLLEKRVSLIINVVDASLLGRSLELTLQLMEYGIPMLLCLNMADEAERKGIVIDSTELSSLLQMSTVSTIANKGVGIDELFKQVFRDVAFKHPPIKFKMTRHVESVVMNIASLASPVLQNEHLPPRLAAIKLLEDDPYFLKYLSPIGDRLRGLVDAHSKKLAEAHGQPADMVLSAEYHAAAMYLFEQVATVRAPIKSWRTRTDDFLMHPFWGYIFMTAILLAFFVLVFKLGSFLEEPILSFFSRNSEILRNAFSSNSLLYHTIDGMVQGLAGGLAIILPYLLPFLLGMALLEDIGYLPRLAYLVDGFMHRMGLHGTALIPAILGYGCSVPAIMATRILSSARDRFIASVMAILVPCSARMMIIFGLVGFYLGGIAAFSIYLLNLVVIILVGAFLAKSMPEDTPGMIMEIPSYQWPRLKNLFAKTWLRMKDFILFAWPILIVGSLVLSLISYFHYDQYINKLLSPITALLGLPANVGITLIFGVLRKELSLIMLMQALGTTDVLAILSPAQVMVFTLFVVFYFPCLATFGILGRELGWKKAVLASLISIILALLIGTMGRFIVPIFW
ncbi:ferrous iron transport protein B [candidate division KSB1 bacterium]|nr:ferrous iron transport protein B [candidate division KSB1 bacterium]